MAIEQLGRFKITGILGRGAMGNVYRAHDPLIERDVAIKTVACEGLSQEEANAFEQRFYREAKSAGRLSHPGIVTIHDVGRSEGLAYIAMELLTGQSLREMLDSGVVLPPDRCVEIAADIADGLAFAHAHDVVHRDIKPANIMVQENGSIKIADFGVALIPSSSSTVAGTAFGSPKYMSPEQVTGQKVDGRSDIFSLGVVLYEMLTGRPPFTGDELTAVLYQVLHGAPPLPSSFHHELPRVVDRLVAKAMAKDPERRYQSAAELASDLRKCRRLLRQRQKVITAPGETKGPEQAEAKEAKAATGSFSWRHPAVLAGGLLVVGLAVGGMYASAKRTPAKETVAVVSPEPGKAAPVASVPVPLEPVPVVSQSKVESDTPATENASATNIPDAPRDGIVRLAIAPWGEVLVDGKPAGVAPPLTELRLSSGKHRIEIRNAGFPPYRQQVDIADGAKIRIKHKFQ
jgi:serine/threonine-protein kinase